MSSAPSGADALIEVGLMGQGLPSFEVVSGIGRVMATQASCEPARDRPAQLRLGEDEDGKGGPSAFLRHHRPVQCHLEGGSREPAVRTGLPGHRADAAAEAAAGPLSYSRPRKRFPDRMTCRVRDPIGSWRARFS